MSWFSRETPEPKAERVFTAPEPIIVRVPAPARPDSLPKDTGDRLRAMVQTCRMWYVEHLPYDRDVPTGLLQEYGRLLESSAREWFAVGPDEPCCAVLVGWRDSWWSYLNTRMDAFKVDAAQEHRVVLSEREDFSKLWRQMVKLREVADCPIDYSALPEPSAVEVAPNVMYGEFAALLRELGVPEDGLLALLTRLTDLVKQYREIVPILTVDTARQLEARILVDRFDADQRAQQIQEIQHPADRDLDRAPAQLERSCVERETLRDTAALDNISSQLTVLNQSAQRQSESLSTIKWLHLIDGLFGH